MNMTVVLTSIAAWLHASPVLCLFLTVFIGTIIGRVHYKGVGFGAVVGSLIAGILIGILATPELPDLLRWTFFYLFLFAVGYSVGPQFFGSLKREAVPQILLAVVVAVSGLATVIAMAAVFGFDEGIAVGVLSGGMTQSAALGTGLNAIAALPLDEARKAVLAANAPLADAITYGFGDLGLILFLTWIGPAILRADLKKEATILEASLAGSGMDTQALSGSAHDLRAYRIEAGSGGTTIEALEDRFAEARLSVHRVRRGTDFLTLAPSLRLEAGDAVVVSARRGALLAADRAIGSEVHEAELLSVPLVTVAVVITNRDVHGMTLGEVAQNRKYRGVYLESLQRGTVLLPREAGTVLARGDILRIVGTADDVERASARMGFVERDLSRTDMTILAGGICVGMLLGFMTLTVSGVTLGLGTAGSILVVGLVTGWARSRYPVFGAIPEPAQRLLMDIGLIVFIAVVGLHAGPHAVDAYRVSGGRFFVNILLAGMAVTMVPLAAGTLAARFIFGLSPLMTLGGLAGAQTCTPGLNALRDASGSNVGALAYTVPYAIGNILLTLWGPLVVVIVHAMRE